MGSTDICSQTGVNTNLESGAEICEETGVDSNVYSEKCKEQLRREIESQIADENFYKNLMRKLDKGTYRVKRDELMRRFQTEKNEKNMQESICRQEQLKCWQEKRTQEDENFAKAIREMKDNATRESAVLKQLHACDPELRNLEKELRRAYYAKTLYAQRLEGESLKLEEKMRQHENYELLVESWTEFDKKEEDKQIADGKKKRDYYKALRNQLDNTSSKMAKKFDEDQRDKAMIDDVLNTLQQEEIQDFLEKSEKVKLYQSEINHFLEARDMHREREQARLREEEEKIKDYLAKKEQETTAYKEAKKERELAKASIVARAIERMMEEQFKREELEELRRELYEEELAEEVRRRDVEELAKKLRHMTELREAAEETKKLRAEKLAAEKKEEEDFREQLLLKFAEDERLEQMGNQKRRQKEREHRKKVEEMINDRRALRAQEREQAQKTLSCFDEEEKRRQALIDEERLKLLREHGSKLLGFMTRGTIKSQAELEKLGEPFISYYRNQPTEPDPSTIDFEPCEEEIFKTMEIPKYAKY